MLRVLSSNAFYIIPSTNLITSFYSDMFQFFCDMLTIIPSGFHRQ